MKKEPIPSNFEPESNLIMIEFAKLHVKAALKKASEEACTKFIPFTDDEEVDKESILNAYPENLIK